MHGGGVIGRLSYGHMSNTIHHRLRFREEINPVYDSQKLQSPRPTYFVSETAHSSTDWLLDDMKTIHCSVGLSDIVVLDARVQSTCKVCRHKQS